ncbi:MAG: tyrosine-protein phosphatase, partial [bacterium]
MRTLLRLLALALAVLLTLSAMAFAESADCPTVETGVREIRKYGNLVLDISGDALLALGYDYGDIVTAAIGDQAIDAPICSEYGDVDIGTMVLRIEEAAVDAEGSSSALLAINGGDLATWLGLAALSTIDEEPGYRWDYAEPYQDGVTVVLSLKEKGGYLDRLAERRLTLTIKREDYPDLTDEQYANFRNVATTGMGAHVLYRSSSPVNPQYGRNMEADAAVNAAGICAVMNMADNAATMVGYPDYANSYYAQLDVIPLNLIVDFQAPSFLEGLAEGFRFLAAHDGPYLIHCTIGKDRAGFACAVLEALMGATAEEIVADYMVSYYNYYGIRPGTADYETIADGNIRKSLAAAFDIDDISAADLAECAEAFLLKIGMTDEEIDALKTQ